MKLSELEAHAARYGLRKRHFSRHETALLLVVKERGFDLGLIVGELRLLIDLIDQVAASMDAPHCWQALAPLNLAVQHLAPAVDPALLRLEPAARDAVRAESSGVSVAARLRAGLIDRRDLDNLRKIKSYPAP